MNRKILILLSLTMALSLPLNVWAATTLGESLSVDDGGDPDLALDAGDAYIEGTLEVDGLSYFGEDLQVSSASGGFIDLFNPTIDPDEFTVIGSATFSGYDDGGNLDNYASISGVVYDDTDTSEDGILAFSIIEGGSLKTKALFTENGLNLWDNVEPESPPTPGYRLSINTNSSEGDSLAVGEGDVRFDTTTYEDAFFLDFDADGILLNNPGLQMRTVTPDATEIVSVLQTENSPGGGIYRPLFGAVITTLPQAEANYPANGLMGISSGAGKGLYINNGDNITSQFNRIRTSARVITETSDSPYTVLVTDEYISYQRTDVGSGSIDLPAITTLPNGYEITIKDANYNASVNNITVNPSGADTIEEGAAYLMNADGQAITMVANSNTNNWEVY